MTALRQNYIRCVGLALVCVIVVCHVCVTAAATNDARILESLRAQWEQGPRVDPSTHVEWRIELVQPKEGLEWLDKTFWAVSEPTSPAYGNHVTVSDMAKHLTPPRQDVDAVMEWASAGGVSDLKLSVTGDYVFASTPAGAVETLFSTHLHTYRHRVTGARVVRASESMDLVPPAVHSAGLSHVVSAVVGVADFPVDARRFGGRPAVAEDAAKVTPPVIWKAYDLGSAPTSFSPSETSQSVAEFEQAYFYPSDLNNFQKMFHLEVKNLTRIVGVNNPNSGYLGECSLDTEYISAVGRGIDTWMWSRNQFDMTAWAQAILSTPGAPLVHSVSWGSGETGFPQSQALRSNTEFQKMGAAGFTVLTASGDDGTGSTGFFSCGVFSPTFPASSPYVTAVGGTTLPTSSSTESGWSKGGGGFSNYFQRPTYQTSVVDKYISGSGATLPAQKYWNATGRGIPDVSAMATNFQVLISNYLGPLSGTSAATPTWAGILAVINGLRSQAGGKPLGFANPALYGLSGGVGTDITAGNNKVSSCPAGFPAVAGWDAITGLGTPLFTTLKSGLVN